MNWHERPVRMMRLDYLNALERMKDADLDELARTKRRGLAHQLRVGDRHAGHRARDGLCHHLQHDKFEKYGPLGDWDLIREYLPHARKYGIRVLAYLNMHWFAYDFAEHHPGLGAAPGGRHSIRPRQSALWRRHDSLRQQRLA